MRKQIFILALCLLSLCVASCTIVNPVPSPEDTPTTPPSSNPTSETNYAPVNSSAGRTSCEYVQLWKNGPKWATFNVGATITDYSKLKIGADKTYADEATAPYYNTANVGGLYPTWKNPEYNGRMVSWTKNSVSSGSSDVATAIWGTYWCTPTHLQLDTLVSPKYGKTFCTWCDGVTTQYVPGCTLKGYKISGLGQFSDKSIFLPAAGLYTCTHNWIAGASKYGYYWTRTEYDMYGATYLTIRSEDRDFSYYSPEMSGYSTRAVLAE